MYHGIILCGSPSDQAGRAISGYRLRTAAEDFGYKILVIDSACAMTSEELETLLSNVITDKTLFLAISAVWFYQRNDNVIQWLNDDFFSKIKARFNHIQLIVGNAGKNWNSTAASSLLYKVSDWALTGFSDESFPRLLKLLDGHSDHGLIWTKDKNNKNTVDSNKMHTIPSPDTILTRWEPEDNFMHYQPVPLELSRGCIFRCTFCGHPFQGKKDADSYIRTPENIAIELRRNYDMFGTTRYSIMDDTMNDSMEKLDRLQKAIEISKIPNFEFNAFIKPELLVTKPKMIESLTQLGLRGAFVGLESFNKKARTAIGKGTDIEKIFNALSQLCQINPKTKLYGSIIVGLPGDTENDIYKWNQYFIEGKGSIFKSWIFHGLKLYKSDLDDSPAMAKNPEKYGYKFDQSNPNDLGNWYSDTMNRTTADKIAYELCKNYLWAQTAGGWQVSSLWNLGLSDEQISKLTLAQINLEQSGRDQVRKRAEALLKKYT